MKKRKKKQHQSQNTPINERNRQGKHLKSPFSALGGAVSWSSWKDDHLPNIIWACVLAGNLEREHYLRLFRKIASNARPHLNKSSNASLCHNFLALLDEKTFKDIFEPLTTDAEVRKLVASIQLVRNLPDAASWCALVDEEHEDEELWNCLARGVFATLDHQSQEATDVRWLKVVFLTICGRLIFPSSMSQRTEELRLYPELGDMREVRPFIRATEMSIRNMETGSNKPDSVPQFDADVIWSEFLQKTRCAAAPIKRESEKFHKDALSDEISSVIEETINHFMGGLKNTNVDARKDASFGLTLYALSLAYEMANLPSNFLASGRALLRIIVESFITLRFLRQKDNPTIWLQYRRYGSGQTALAFLKASDLDEAPPYIDMERLEFLANEDAWLETQDIKLGAWADKNLRAMAQEIGVKDVYDQYYDWTSGFTHGHWGAVRDTVFTTCLNPLHRMHRVPHPMQPMPSVLLDCCKVSNRLLDELGALYPTFTRRIQWREKTQSPKSGPEETAVDDSRDDATESGKTPS